MSDGPVFILLGPTGSGKTAVSLPLAERIGAEIVCLDSKQVFAGMAIGTAQPSAVELARIPHHLFGTVDPFGRFSAGDYGRLARGALEALDARDARALFVGGSGLYLRALAGGLAEGLPNDDAVRERWRDRAAREGSAFLHAELARLDPPLAARLHPNDTQRITRALEVIEITGRPMSELQSEGTVADTPLSRRFRIAVLDRNREELYARINARTGELLSGGMIEEVSGLLERGLDPEQPVFRAHGYPEIRLFLNGAIDRAELGRRLAQVTRNYAKRQMTWFRRLEGAILLTVPPGEPPEVTAGRVVALWGAAGPSRKTLLDTKPPTI